MKKYILIILLLFLILGLGGYLYINHKNHEISESEYDKSIKMLIDDLVKKTMHNEIKWEGNNSYSGEMATTCDRKFIRWFDINVYVMQKNDYSRKFIYLIKICFSINDKRKIARKFEFYFFEKDAKYTSYLLNVIKKQIKSDLEKEKKDEEKIIQKEIGEYLKEKY